MNYDVIIPAYNEATLIKDMLQSLINQTVAPGNIVVVNDGSTDTTNAIVSELILRNRGITLINSNSDAFHLPGSKVIHAFNKGLSKIRLKDCDVIVKLDADLILPPDYFETVLRRFAENPKAGIVGGFAYIEKNGQWILENLTDKDHIRGAFKSYRRECFEQIGGLKPAMGWDTVDELLAKYYGWEVVTIAQLKVRHLKPTGANYSKAARFKQGEAFYSLGYGLLITAIASAKLAMMKRKPLLFLDYMAGFLRAKKQRLPVLVTKEQAQFIRSYRWTKMRKKIF